tara:strand:+ start:155 stop:295 length:141 start_codon:yes stop_codon:yes gene_type:complete
MTCELNRKIIEAKSKLLEYKNNKVNEKEVSIILNELYNQYKKTKLI